jgi:tetratricopeptide (TPR) repeat protein
MIKLKSLYFPWVRIIKWLNDKRIFILFILVGFLTYGHSFLHGFIADDQNQIIENTSVHSLKNIFHLFTQGTFYSGGNKLVGIYYKPITMMYFSFIFSFFGQNAFFFHGFQLILHIINSIIVFLIFRYFFNKYISIFLSLIFLIHPLNVEAVSYISAVQEPLSFFLGSCALLFIVRYPLTLKRIIIASLLLVGSMLSKETGILFLFITLIYIYTFKKSKKIYLIILSLITSIIYAILRFYVAGIYFNERAIAPIMKQSLSERLLNFPKIMNYYIFNFFVPNNLIFAQSWTIKNLSINNFYLPIILDAIFLLIIFILGAFVWFYKKNELRIYIFFLFWLFLGLLFHSQIFPLDLTVADRWFYFSIVGLLGLIGLIIKNVKIKNNLIRLIYLIVGILIVSLFLVRSIVRNFDWKDEFTLYDHDIKISTNSSQLENLYGTVLAKQNQYEEAQEHFMKSIKLFPIFSTWNNLAVNYERLGKIDEAIQAYQKAILDADNYYLTYENFAILLYFYKDTHVAKDFTQKAINKFPNDSKLKIVFALIEFKLGQKQKAIISAKEAYTLNPNKLNSYVYSHLLQNLPIDIKSK